MSANTFSSAYPLSSHEILKFSHDLDVHAAEHPHFFDDRLLQLINEHFGYVTSSLSRHVNNRYCGIIINSSQIPDAYSEAQYYSVYFQKYDPFSYAMYEAKRQTQKPILLKSSETLTSNNAHETYTNYLCRVGLKWSLALVYDEYHLVLDKPFQDEDFSPYEKCFWEAVYELIEGKYQTQQALRRTLTVREMTNALLDNLSTGVLLLNEENKIIDANQSGLALLTAAMGTCHLTVAASSLVFRALKERFCESDTPTVTFRENRYLLSVTFADPLQLVKCEKCITIKPVENPHPMKKENMVLLFAQQYHLTMREVDVLELLWKGNSYKEIAARLSISLCTVRTHINKIFQRTGVNNQRALLNKYRSIDEIHLAKKG